jgi:small subunit ribosomal protein S8e
MVKWQGLSKKKPSGGRRWFLRGKRKFEYGREPAHTKLGELKRKLIRTRGGEKKYKLFQTSKVNVFDPKKKKSFVTEIESVEKTPASRHFKRSNIMTKSAIIKTKIGYAEVTNRPGQDGQIQAVLVDYTPEKKKR